MSATKAFAAMAIFVFPGGLAYAQRTAPDAAAAYVLSVQGAPPVRVRSVSGGGLFRELSSTDVSVEALSFEWDLSGDLIPWLAQAVNEGAVPTSEVTVYAVNGADQPLSQRTLRGVTIAGITFPRLDTAASEPVLLTVDVDARESARHCRRKALACRS